MTDRYPPSTTVVVPSNSIVNPSRRIPDPVAYSGSEIESGDEGPSDALVRRARGPIIYHRPEDSDDAEKPEESGEQKESRKQEDAEDSEGEMKPPVRKNTVEIADESEVEDEPN
jgi:hypothetical protein